MIRKWLHENRRLLAFLFLFGLMRVAVADWNPVPSGSMRPSILEGDVVLINRLAFDVKVPLTNHVLLHTGEPRRGEIVTFFSPQNGTRLIKRLVAVPGDMVELRDNVLIVNGEAAQYEPLEIVEESLPDGGHTRALRFDERIGTRHHAVQWLPDIMGVRRNFGPTRVPADHFLMFGDNRDNSADSRYFGLVPRELLIGRAERILVSAAIKENWMPRFTRFGQRLQ